LIESITSSYKKGKAVMATFSLQIRPPSTMTSKASFNETLVFTTITQFLQFSVSQCGRVTLHSIGQMIDVFKVNIIHEDDDRKGGNNKYYSLLLQLT